MICKTKMPRLFSLIVAVALLLSVCAVPAMAVDIEEAKASLATVDITQTLNGTETDKGVHNYAISGDDVSITYTAALQMTELMATYLQARQEQLYYAQFTVNFSIDLEHLEWAAAGEQSFTFKSTFLMPVEQEGYTVTFEEKDTDGYYVFTVTAGQDALAELAANGIPVELIAYASTEDSGRVHLYNYEAAANDLLINTERFMYAEYSVEDWMKPITLELASLKVTDETRKSVTPGKTVTIAASGTVTGTFSYITAEVPDSILRVSEILCQEKEFGGDYSNTLAFGDDEEITGWSSNVVTVTLKNKDITPTEPESPYLNQEDHFAYIIGYPDGMVHPEGNITRAEVATIFFRMLKDETRNEYWSKNNDYTDVNGDDWFNNAVSTLTNLGVVEGYPDGSFRPNGSITRAEFAAIAVRFFSVDGITWDADVFSDIADHWANEYINEAYALSLVNGYPDGTYKPQNNITRAEAMKIVNNTLRRSPVQEGLLPVTDMIVWPDNADTAEWYYEVVQEATNSHEYVISDELGGEEWTEALPVRDWAAFETEWANANSAENPGEVVDP